MQIIIIGMTSWAIEASSKGLTPYKIANELLLLEMETERASFLFSKLFPIYESNLYAHTFKKLEGCPHKIFATIENMKKRHLTILLNHIELYLGSKESARKQIPFLKYIESQTGNFPAMVHFELKTANWPPEWLSAWNRFMNDCFNRTLEGMPPTTDAHVLKRFIMRFRKNYQEGLPQFKKQVVYIQTLIDLCYTIEDELQTSLTTI